MVNNHKLKNNNNNNQQIFLKIYFIYKVPLLAFSRARVSNRVLSSKVKTSLKNQNPSLRRCSFAFNKHNWLALNLFETSPLLKRLLCPA